MLLVLFATPLPREISALLVAACLIVSRVLPTRQLLDDIDLPLLILFAALFVVNDAFARTGLPEDAVRALASHGLLPDRLALMAPIALFLSNTIGNVPAVVMILKVWHGYTAGHADRAGHPVDAGRQSAAGRQPRQHHRCRARQAARRAADLPRPRQSGPAHHHPVDAVCLRLAVAGRLHGVLDMDFDKNDIDAALVTRLVAAQFPQWAQLPVKPVLSAAGTTEPFTSATT